MKIKILVLRAIYILNIIDGRGTCVEQTEQFNTESGKQHGPFWISYHSPQASYTWRIKAMSTSLRIHKSGFTVSWVASEA